ncbi:MAG: Ku protein [Longimicrobiales bacterium]
MPDSKRKRPRAFWSGTITFGLVSVPVDLYPAQRARRVSLRMLSPSGTPLRRRYYDPETGEEVPGDEIVRGYDIDDRYVTVSDEELESLAPEKSRDIDLRVFVPVDQLDPLYYDRAYFLTPGDGSTKAYRLLAQAMEAKERAGIATFVMRGKEYLIAILSRDGILRAETLRFADEVRSAEAVGLPEPVEPEAKEVKTLRAAIRELAADDLDPDELEDQYRQRVQALVEEKRAGGEDVVTVAAETGEEEEEADVIDLMDVLKRSLRRQEEAPRPPKRAPGRRVGEEERVGALNGRTKAELYERAKQLDIPGRSGMSKDELIAAIRRSA